MSELTKEYLDQSLKNLPSKQDVQNIVDKGVENLARIVNAGFEDLAERLDVRERTAALEKDMARIKEALHIK
jgi:hypothetical protein